MISKTKTSMRSAFSPQPDEMPETLPVFPLEDALLLPGGRLPLNIFEPHYLQMVRDQLATPLRLIGLIQPFGDAEGGDETPLRAVGCAGRIVSFAEQDSRYLIALEGLCRFAVAEEIEPQQGYRRVHADWSKYMADLYPDAQDYPELDRPLLESRLRTYLDYRGMAANWDAIGLAEDPLLITSLAMLCPFNAEEKQALLEAEGAPKLTELLYALLEISAHGPSRSESRN